MQAGEMYLERVIATEGPMLHVILSYSWTTATSCSASLHGASALRGNQQSEGMDIPLAHWGILLTGMCETAPEQMLVSGSALPKGVIDRNGSMH
jgi:hypothetical protein